MSETAVHPRDVSPARTVLVTGAAHRLGREIALCFAAAGWDVMAHYRNSAEAASALRDEIALLGQRCWLVQADLEAEEAAGRILDAAGDRAGRLPECIVNNASAFESDDAYSASARGLHRRLACNTVSPLLLANGLASRVARMSRAGAGRHSVVHVLDQKVHNLNPDYFSYTVSKLALAGSVALQAQALAPHVRVCGVSPGLLYPSGPQTRENFDRAGRVNLLRRPLQPADVARCVLLIAENVSLNGTIIQADNGQHLVALDRDVMFAVDGVRGTRT